ncbi:RNA polymerase sigma factor [Micromonospora fluostatini]|uniref:RNA polymerase sigma factor n=1 Tax=Micromonospora sp. JCM 30529 TaxID=3421643 RepID=UPI003D163895
MCARSAGGSGEQEPVVVQDQGGIIRWLTTIAHRLVLDHAKARRARYEHPAGLTDAYHTPEPQNSTSAESAVIRKYELHQALAVYHYLGPRYRAYLYLRHWQGLTVNQTAAASTPPSVASETSNAPPPPPHRLPHRRQSPHPTGTHPALGDREHRIDRREDVPGACAAPTHTASRQI